MNPFKFFWVIYRRMTSSTQSTDINTVQGVAANHGAVHQTINNGISENTIKLIVDPYTEKIARLERELKQSKGDNLQVLTALNQACEELKQKRIEIEQLQQLAKNSTNELVKTATEILEKEGIASAIAFLQNQTFTEREQQLQSDMRDFAEKYEMEAQLLSIENRHDEAMTAYEQMLTYHRSAERLFDVAHFSQRQNDFDRATSRYTEALERCRQLAQTNPAVYQPYVATTLNNLAVLYRAQNRMDGAETAYDEALTIRRQLTQTNRRVFGIDCANTLVMGGGFARAATGFTGRGA